MSDWEMVPERLCDLCGKPFKQGETFCVENLEGMLTQTHTYCLSAHKAASPEATPLKEKE